MRELFSYMEWRLNMIIQEKIHNIENNEIVEIQREMTPDELIAFEKNRKVIEDNLAKKAEESAARAVLLEKLGITEEEAKLLFS